MVEIDITLLFTAISGLFGILVTGSGAVIRYLVAENKVLREGNDVLRQEALSMAKSAVAAMDKLAGK